MARRALARTRLALAVALATLLASSTAPGLNGAAPPPAAQAHSRPVFRSGVDLVPLDVVVLDKDHRPVRGLTAADFTITENGDPQTVETFEEVAVPDPDEGTAPWMRETAPDVVSNDIQARRLVMIVLDDANVGVDHGEPKSLRQIAQRVVDGLGPSDMAAVVYTFLGRAENFTTDRRKLRSAIEDFKPRGFGQAGPPLGCQLKPGGCAVDTIARVADVMRAAPAGRKLLVFISPALQTGAEIAARPDEFTGLEAIRTMFANLQLANISVYSYDPRGLLTSGGISTNEIALAEATGGRRVQGTNEPESHVRQMFRESAAYYLIGYRTTHPRADGQFRRIRVRVNRPDLEVRARNGYYAPKPVRSKASTRPVLEQVEQAIQQGFPVSDVGVRATSAAFAMPGAKTAALVSVLSLREPAQAATTTGATATSKKRVDVVAAAFDMEGRSKGLQRQTIELTLRPEARRDAEYEVTSRLSLAPGRYEIRIAAVVDGRAGSVYSTVEIPNFSKDRLSLSGVAFEKSPRGLTSTTSLVRDLIPIVPTAARTFGADDNVPMFVRVYQGGTRPVEPVTVRLSVTDAHAVSRVASTSQLPSAAFATGRAADFTSRLPTRGLEPGEYLLTITASVAAASGASAGATVGGETALQRQVRFAVR